MPESEFGNRKILEIVAYRATANAENVLYYGYPGNEPGNVLISYFYSEKDFQENEWSTISDGDMIRYIVEYVFRSLKFLVR